MTSDKCIGTSEFEFSCTLADQNLKHENEVISMNLLCFTIQTWKLIYNCTSIWA